MRAFGRENSFGRKNGHVGVRNSEFGRTVWHVGMCGRSLGRTEGNVDEKSRQGPLVLCPNPHVIWCYVGFGLFTHMSSESIRTLSDERSGEITRH